MSGSTSPKSRRVPADRDSVLPMAEKGYSAFGLDPRRVRDILRPLVEQMTKMEGSKLSDRRERFIYYQLADAVTSADCLIMLTDAGLRGEPVGMGAIEVVTRRLVEQAIVVRYVHAAPDDAVVDSYLKTSAHEWEFSWGIVPTDDEVRDLPVSRLPRYGPMADLVSPELRSVYKKLSYLSHPRGAFPYVLRVAQSPLDHLKHFELDLAAMCAFMDIAVRHILFPYRGDPGASFI